MCAQPCRMYYKSQNGSDGYLFSMKDLSTISRINELVDAGVRSFKIEGRMKSPEYVAVVTHAYRQAIDGNLANMDETIHQLKTVFSRETSHSYLFGRKYSAEQRDYKQWSNQGGRYDPFILSRECRVLCRSGDKV